MVGRSTIPGLVTRGRLLPLAGTFQTGVSAQAKDGVVSEGRKDVPIRVLHGRPRRAATRAREGGREDVHAWGETWRIIDLGVEELVDGAEGEAALRSTRR